MTWRSTTAARYLKGSSTIAAASARRSSAASAAAIGSVLGLVSARPPKARWSRDHSAPFPLSRNAGASMEVFGRARWREAARVAIRSAIVFSQAASDGRGSKRSICRKAAMKVSWTTSSADSRSSRRRYASVYRRGRWSRTRTAYAASDPSLHRRTSSCSSRPHSSKHALRAPGSGICRTSRSQCRPTPYWPPPDRRLGESLPYAARVAPDRHPAEPSGGPRWLVADGRLRDSTQRTTWRFWPPGPDRQDRAPMLPEETLPRDRGPTASRELGTDPGRIRVRRRARSGASANLLHKTRAQ